MPINSASCNFDWKPDNFELYDVNNQKTSFYDSFGLNGILILFICNHCPYVNAIEKKIKYETDMLKNIGVNSLAIMSNDQESYSDDTNENLKAQINRNNFTFPYLVDKNQSVARSFNAICTPDFFGFNSEGRLQYRGRLDSLGKNPDLGKRELYEAMQEIIKNKYTTKELFPSIGCSIKWKL